MRPWLLPLGLVLSATTASADPSSVLAGRGVRADEVPSPYARSIPVAVEAPFAGDGLFRPPVEWSTWVRGSVGIARAPREPEPNAARLLQPPVDPPLPSWELGVGIEASLALSKHGDVRIGGWAELRGFERGDVFAGGELVITRVPKRVEMFLYEGHGILAARVGRSTTHETAAIAYGYLAPYWLEGPCRNRFFDIDTGVCEPRPKRHTRYMTGVRIVGTVTRAIDDPREWSATLGLEFETVGALRMMLALRSWY